MQLNDRGTGFNEPLTAESPSLKQVKLGDVALMATRGEADGWYVSEHGDKWAIGLQSRGERYLVTLGAQAMTFDTMAVAVKYLRALITPTGVEQPSASGSTLTGAFADAIARINRAAPPSPRSSRFE